MSTIEVFCPDCKGVGQFKPCGHLGCFAHITHPCEKCGRLQGACMSCNGTGKIKIEKPNLNDILRDIPPYLRNKNREKIKKVEDYINSLEKSNTEYSKGLKEIKNKLIELQNNVKGEE